MSALSGSSESLACQLAQTATNVRFRLAQDQAYSCLNPAKTVTLLGKFITGGDGFKAALREELQRLPWSSYRSRFTPIPGPDDRSYTSDVGWGCTIRVAQMLLLHALSRHLRIPFEANPFLLASFIAEAGDSSVFALRQFIEVGKKYFGRRPGDWQSPSSVSYVLQLLVAQNTMVQGLTVHVATDGVVSKAEMLADMNGLCEEDIACLCSQRAESCPLCSEFLWVGSAMVLIPVMLGLQKIAKGYYDAVRLCLSSPYSLGIIGAKPGAALHVVGYQEDRLLCVDPHYVQKAVLSEDKLLKHIQTYQCPSVRCLSLAEADSSMALGFFFATSAEFEAFAVWIIQNYDVLGDLIHVKERPRPVPSDLLFID